MQRLNRASAGDSMAIETKDLGRVEYEPTWRAMQSFTAARTPDTPDELWIVEHPPVYTVGIAGRSAHLPRERTDIPVVKIDRGGQITYHGPGQVVVYLLLDMKRRGITVRPLVRLMETAVIDSLADFGICAAGRVEAPGVYVGNAKIAALGLRVTRGCCYHGLALNVDMDLSPFSDIDPCGYPGLSVTRLEDLGVDASFELVADKVTQHLMRLLT
jgi:lipoyl(octanoyl) transferase